MREISKCYFLYSVDVVKMKNKMEQEKNAKNYVQKIFFHVLFNCCYVN